MCKKSLLFSALGSVIILLACCGGRTPNYDVRLKTDSDSASYYIGFFYGAQLASSDFEDLNVDAIARGWSEAINDVKNKNEEDVSEKMMTIQMYLNDFVMNMQARASEKTLKEGVEFLQANSRKSGVVTLPSGLQYKIIKDASGAKPARDNSVEVHYHGTLTDGTIFDSTKERGMTATFPVDGVVEGFREALTLMSEGAIWEVYIPSEMGYGQYPPPGSPIKPGSVIIFELELVKIISSEEN